MRNRRSKLGILSEILAIAGEERAISKTHIMYRANISFRQLQSYLSLLLELELMKEIREEKRVTYVITEKGKLFLELYRDIERLTTIPESK